MNFESLESLKANNVYIEWMRRLEYYLHHFKYIEHPEDCIYHLNEIQNAVNHLKQFHYQLNRELVDTED